jgi:hypothetical protein
MGKIILILIAVFVIVFIIGLFNGEKTDDAAAGGLGAALGCGAQIFQLALAAFFIWLGFVFLSWIFG